VGIGRRRNLQKRERICGEREEREGDVRWRERGARGLEVVEASGSERER
jgi:hypothetical protein